MISLFDYVKGLLLKAENGTVLGLLSKRWCAGIMLLCMALTIVPTVTSCKDDSETEVEQSEVSKIEVDFWINTLGIIPRVISTTKSASVYDANPNVAKGDIVEKSYYNNRENTNEKYILNSNLTTNDKKVYYGTITHVGVGDVEYTKDTWTKSGDGLIRKMEYTTDGKPQDETAGWDAYRTEYWTKNGANLEVYNVTKTGEKTLSQIYSPDTSSSISVELPNFNNITYKLENFDVIQK